jgi:hypothetical protein
MATVPAGHKLDGISMLWCAPYNRSLILLEGAARYK